MTPSSVISDLRARGVTLVADGDTLRCRPASTLTESDLALLRAHKAEVLRALRAERAPGVLPNLICYVCRSRSFWRSTSNMILCGTCRPPHADLVAEWIGPTTDQRTR
jgi:hypothetical protein